MGLTVVGEGLLCRKEANGEKAEVCKTVPANSTPQHPQNRPLFEPMQSRLDGHSQVEVGPGKMPFAVSVSSTPAFRVQLQSCWGRRQRVGRDATPTPLLPSPGLTTEPTDCLPSVGTSHCMCGRQALQILITSLMTSSEPKSTVSFCLITVYEAGSVFLSFLAKQPPPPPGQSLGSHPQFSGT